MAVGKIQVHVSQLKLGMFVSELDRPWLGTPFLFQGFRIQRIEEIDKLKQMCESVLIDLEKSTHGKRSLSAVNEGNKSKPRQIYQMAASFEDELVSANEIRENTQVCVDQLFEDVAHGRMIDLAAVKRVIHDAVDGVLRNPDAHMSLTQLKSWDSYTAQHSINVSVMALTFARHLGLPRAEMEMIGIGALLHDIGKLKTPLEVLNKPGKLTDDEFSMMKAHPVHGRELIEKRYGLSHHIADMAYSHHERVAGGGYPRGLNGNEISTWSKIVAIVDVYDAITSDRCYHKGMPPTEALTKMYGWRLKDFDGELLEQFIQCVGIYPVGSLVELTTGEVGIVISVNPASRLRPKVDLLLDAKKNPYYPSRVLNLADCNVDELHATCAIKDVLNPGAFGVNIKEHLRPMQQAKAKMLGS